MYKFTFTKRSITLLSLLTVITSMTQYWMGEKFGLFSVAFAQTESLSANTPKTPEMAVSMAKNAFEYRDFKKVIAILDPWVHPPRIADRSKMAEARRLLGISQHLQGNTKQAEEEFAQLVILAPDTILDPFIVPPAVIQTFERIKRAVVGTATQAKPKEQIKTIVRPVVTVHPSVSFVPFAYAQLATLEDQKAWGLTWLTTQALGLALNIGGYWAANGLRTSTGIPESDKARFDGYVAGMYSGIALWSVGYLGSVIQSYSALSTMNREVQLPQLETEKKGVSEGRSLILTLPFP